MLIISQRWIRRPRIAVVMAALPRKPAHSSKPLLEVIMREVLSLMAEMNPKKRLASAGEKGMKPTAFTTTGAALWEILEAALAGAGALGGLEDGHAVVQGFKGHGVAQVISDRRSICSLETLRWQKPMAWSAASMPYWSSREWIRRNWSLA